jgi:hypothetical protein
MAPRHPRHHPGPRTANPIADPAPAPPSPPESEARHPLRATFACWLDPREVERVELELWERWIRGLEEGTLDPPSVATRLAAVAADLRRTASVLADLGDEHRISCLTGPELHGSLLADPRALEVEAIAERIEACLAWRATRAQPLPPGLGEAALVPSTYRPEPVEEGT